MALGAASRPLDEILVELDLSSGEALSRQDPVPVQRLRDRIDEWMYTLHADWED